MGKANLFLPGFAKISLPNMMFEELVLETKHGGAGYRGHCTEGEGKELSYKGIKWEVDINVEQRSGKFWSSNKLH